MKKIIKIATIFIIITMIYTILLSSFNHCLAIDIVGPNPYTDTGTSESGALEDMKSDKDDEIQDRQRRTLTDIFSQAANFLGIGKGDYEENRDMTENLDIIFNIVAAIGTVLSVIIGAILGIKFMMASVEDKAKIKESLIPYIIGCVAIFGAFGIWKLVVSILNQIS